MRKRNIYLLCAITFLQGMVFYAAVATLYRQAAGLSVFQITAIEGISVALSMALEIPWGWAADRLGYRRVMILCNALFLVTKIIFWRAGSFLGFLTERLLLAVVIAAAVMYVIVLTYVFPLTARVQNTSRAMVVNSFLIGTHYLFCTILVFAIHFAVFFVTVRFFTPLMILGEGLCAMLSSHLLRPVLDACSYVPDEEDEEDEEAEEDEDET
jgi:MFS family permease